MGIKFDGTKVKDGGRKLISLKDAAKKIGTSSQGHSTAMVWWFFAK